MRYSSRLPASLAPSELSARLASCAGLVDLTESNPTRCGFTYPAGIGGALAAVDPTRYAPDPFGLEQARVAVARYAGRRGEVGADQVVLTASTSEAYTFLFKLLCAPGESVAVPAPSYPLLDVLARLEAVELERYALVYDGAWRLDRESLVGVLDRGARALVVVEPNNPTGSCLDATDGAAVVELCNQYDVPLIVDQVFAPYRVVESAWTWPAAELPLLVRLDGLSKAAGLPQLKLGWMVLEGREQAAVRERLAWIADAFLSVGAPVQLAAAELLRLAPAIQAQIRVRVARNGAALRTAMARLPAVSVLAADGGWTAVLRLPRIFSDDELVLALAEQAGVLVHPGYFYDFPADGYLVLGLLLPEALHAPAVTRLADTLATLLG